MKKEPFIWLQEDEMRGAAECGCRVSNEDGCGVRVDLCPLHAAAPKMLAAVREIAQTAPLVASGKVDPRARIERIAWEARWAAAVAEGKRGVE